MKIHAEDYKDAFTVTLKWLKNEVDYVKKLASKEIPQKGKIKFSGEIEGLEKTIKLMSEIQIESEITITLWRENKKDQEWNMTLDSIAHFFLKSKFYQEDGDRPVDFCVSLFVVSPVKEGGLNSVIEKADIETIARAALKIKESE